MHDLLALPPRIAWANRYPFRPGEEIPLSWSASLHLVHVLHGHGQVSIAGSWHDIAGGMIAALPWGRSWAFRAARRDPLAIISLHLRFLPWSADDPDRPLHGLADTKPPPPAEAAPVLPPLPRPHSAAGSQMLAEGCLETWHSRDEARQARLRGLALALLAGLLPQSAAMPGGAQSERIAGLLEWLAYHPTATPSRSELETRAGLGRTAFGLAFRRATGRSPAAWLMERRLGLAHRLLTTSRDGIAAIATRVGFEDAFHFSRRFRARYGCSPRQARNTPW
jgi:AraC-like DNA-binding protein